MADYRVKQPGDVLELTETLETAEIGFYVLIDIVEDTVDLCRLGVDPDTDALVVTDTQFQVSLADLSLFHPTRFTIQDAVQSPTVALGDIMEPIHPGDPVPIGLYEVVEIDRDDIRISRLHTNEDGKLATTQRKSWIARSQIRFFRKLKLQDDLRP